MGKNETENLSFGAFLVEDFSDLVANAKNDAAASGGRGKKTPDQLAQERKRRQEVRDKKKLLPNEYDNTADAEIASKRIGVSGTHTSRAGTYKPGNSEDSLANAIARKKEKNKDHIGESIGFADFEDADMVRRKDPGMFTFMKLSEQSISNLQAWMRQHGIPDPVPGEKMHCTVVYSHKSIPYAPLQDSQVISPDTYDLKILGKDNCFVLGFQNDRLQEQWNTAKDGGAEFSYPTFTPHVTLSYQHHPEFQYTQLPAPKFPIILEYELVRPHDKDWKANNGIEESTTLQFAQFVKGEI